MLRVAGIIEESIVDGPGLRTTIFFQGCRHHCEGCHNPQTWSFEGGTEYTPEELLEKVQVNKLIDKITLSGGDPLYQDHKDFMKFISLLKENGYTDIILYTGFTLEEIQDSFMPEYYSARDLQILDQVVFVTDPFVLSEKSMEVRFRGSTNQRVQKIFYSREDNDVYWKDIADTKEWRYLS